ncbi:uncharacterized protein LOC121233861 [Aquila chrysaetos chrysaetos]|uniref:uncharacterized protein LOC121233861 n=1 Tax=Aquila chrysaetos chrysaetos TaxID=223781 RepID=UPI001B7D4154|nr:uncharacterized protein LOC121233861 [Aquila chrysaetos chrysaetos]
MQLEIHSGIVDSLCPHRLKYRKHAVPNLQSDLRATEAFSEAPITACRGKRGWRDVVRVVEAAEGDLQHTRGESSASARFAPRGVPQGGTLETHRSARTPCAFDPGRCAATQTFSADRRWEVPPDPNRSSPGGSSRPRLRDPLHRLTDRERVWASQTVVPSVRQTEPRAFNFSACTPEGEMSHASVLPRLCPAIALLSFPGRALL